MSDLEYNTGRSSKRNEKYEENEEDQQQQEQNEQQEQEEQDAKNVLIGAGAGGGRQMHHGKRIAGETTDKQKKAEGLSGDAIVSSSGDNAREEDENAQPLAHKFIYRHPPLPPLPLPPPHPQWQRQQQCYQHQKQHPHLLLLSQQ